MVKKKVIRKITKATLAKEACVSRPAITKLCAGSLKPALIGQFIDIDHPLVIKYLNSKKKSKTVKVKKKAETTQKKPSKKESVNPPVNPNDELEEPSHYSKDNNIKNIMDLTLRKILAKHGTEDRFKNWVDASKTIKDIQLKDLKIAKEKQDSIERVLVKNHIFGAIEDSNLRLLTDTPKTLATRIFAIAKAGGTIDEAEVLGRELISKQIKNIKATAIRILKKDVK